MRQLTPGISQDPAIQGGRPVIEGTRVPVSTILGHLAAGNSIPDLAEDFGVETEDVLACLAYAAEVIGKKHPPR